MSTRKPTAPVKMVVRSGTCRTEYTGDIYGALDQLLIAAGDSDARLAAIEKLKATHLRVLKWERGEAA
jgi:hypothetical protein